MANQIANTVAAAAATDATSIELTAVSVDRAEKGDANKQIALLRRVGPAAQLAAANLPGKAGKFATALAVAAGDRAVALSASRNNYMPLIELVALATARSVTVEAKRGCFDQLRVLVQLRLSDLEDAGRYHRKDGSLSPKAAQLEALAERISSIESTAEAYRAEAKEPRANKAEKVAA